MLFITCNETLDVKSDRHAGPGGAGVGPKRNAISVQAKTTLAWGKMTALFPGILPVLSGSFLEGPPVSLETAAPPGC